VLDSAGGTDIFQMPPGRMKLTAGTDAMRCLRLSNKVLRWYTDCCRTPIANTAGPRFPLIGVVHSFMDHETDSRSRNLVLGPPLFDPIRHGLVVTSSVGGDSATLQGCGAI
jgi:Family of unknown function (DUF6151)